GVMTVRHRHPAVGRNEALEDARAAVRVGGLDQEADAEGADLNRLFRFRAHPASSRFAASMASRASASVVQLRHQTHIPSRHLIGCQNVSTRGDLLAAPCARPLTLASVMSPWSCKSSISPS